MRSTTCIKDPMVKGDVVYEVPSRFISLTAGLKGKGHRSCLCRLFLEGRCGQGSKCKSFHVDRRYVEQKRRELGVELEENFITEVVVSDGRTVFAVRFPAVLRTRGLDDYRNDFANKKFKPKPLCPHHDPNALSACTADKDCPFIHVKHAELHSLNLKRLRTPCCKHHGDSALKLIGSATVMDGSQTIEIPFDRLAYDESIHKIKKNKIFTMRDVCRPHITSRCKYGRSCGNLHVCRQWWAERELKSRPVSKCSGQNQISFLSDAKFGDFSNEESFGLPIWDENKPPELSEDFDAQLTTSYNSIDIFTAFGKPSIFPVDSVYSMLN